MTERKYKICLSVPIGQREGSMYICESDGRLNGWLEVMGKQNDISGFMHADGSIEISGTIQTLISRIAYAAKGTIIEDAISLKLIATCGEAYHVFGKEIKQNDKIL